MFADFKKAFRRIDDLKDIKVTDTNPCLSCEHNIAYHDKWDNVPHYIEHPETKECRGCIKNINYIIDALTKLKWYEDNDHSLLEEEPYPFD